MSYDELLSSGRIRKENISQKEVADALERAERDLKTAGLTMAHDWDWSFAIAYNAVLQASRAYMFSRGYRPAAVDTHKNTFAFMRVAIGKKNEDSVTFFDRMRVKRNQTVYDSAGLITETEAKSILDKAEAFVETIRGKLDAT